MSDKFAICYTDGASRGNPGHASVGFVIHDVVTNKQKEYARYLGNNLTNNYAEYKAVQMCLDQLVKEKYNQFELRSDSQLVINQLTGKFQVKSENVRPIYQEIQKLLKKFKKYQFVKVPRIQNQLADSLANRALDNKH